MNFCETHCFILRGAMIVLHTLAHLFVRHELGADRMVLGLSEDVVEAVDGALPLLEPHVLLRATQQDLVARRRRSHILTKEREREGRYNPPQAAFLLWLFSKSPID